MVLFHFLKNSVCRLNIVVKSSLGKYFWISCHLLEEICFYYIFGERRGKLKSSGFTRTRWLHGHCGQQYCKGIEKSLRVVFFHHYFVFHICLSTKLCEVLLYTSVCTLQVVEWWLNWRENLVKIFSWGESVFSCACSSSLLCKMIVCENWYKSWELWEIIMFL